MLAHLTSTRRGEGCLSTPVEFTLEEACGESHRSGTDPQDCPRMELSQDHPTLDSIVCE